VSGPPDRILFIVNPNAGTSDQDWGDIVSAVIGTNAQFDIWQTEHAGHATQLAQEGRDAFDLVVAIGGDGTVNEVGRGLVGSDTSMGVVPAGSGNALARALGIPLEERNACRNLLTGSIRRIDAGHIGDDVFLSTAGIGLDAEVCWRFNQDKSGGRGIVPYVKHSVAGVLQYKPSTVRVYLDEKEEPLVATPTLLTVANTHAFGYGAEIAPGAVPGDGWLDVCVVEGMTVPRALLHGHRLFNGTFDRTPGVSRHIAKSVRIERSGAGYYQIDGEAREGGETLEVSLSPGGLGIVVPV